MTTKRGGWESPDGLEEHVLVQVRKPIELGRLRERAVFHVDLDRDERDGVIRSGRGNGDRGAERYGLDAGEASNVASLARSYS